MAKLCSLLGNYLIFKTNRDLSKLWIGLSVFIPNGLNYNP